MGLTGIIYGSIVVAWAAYLVPLALKRHDEAARSRSIDRFSSSMRVLARHGRAASGRVVVAPARPVDRVLRPGLAGTGSTAVVTPAPRPTRAARHAAARRRRWVLSVLVCLVALVAALALAGVVPWFAVLAPVVLVAAFLGLARRQVRRASDSYWVAAHAPLPSNVIRRSPTRVEASHGAAKSADDEPTVPLDADKLQTALAALTEEHNVAVALPTADGGSLWDPLPIVLPTYVDKPVARRTTRTVDLGESTAVPSRRSAQAAQADAPAGASRSTPNIGAGVDSESESLGAEPARVVNG